MSAVTTTITTSPVPTALEELKAKQQQIWSSGDYNRIAAITVPVAETLVDARRLGPGDRVLDVATGTGHAALAAARRSAHATGHRLRARARCGSRAAAPPRSRSTSSSSRATPRHLPFPDGSFDHVVSAIGVMFAADHARAAAQLVRVCRPGGRISLASWTPTGFIGQLLKTVARHVPPPPVAQPPTRWGVADEVRGLLGDDVTDVTAVRRR